MYLKYYKIFDERMEISICWTRRNSRILHASSQKTSSVRRVYYETPPSPIKHHFVNDRVGQKKYWITLYLETKFYLIL